MKTCKIIVVLALLLTAFQACSFKDLLEISIDGEEVDGLSLTFFTEKGFAVKADPGYEDRAGEDPWNENVLSSVEYFLYQDGKTDQDAVLHGYLTNVRIGAPYTVPLTDDVINNILCPGNAKYFEVYAIANHSRIVADPGPGGTESLNGTSVDILANLSQDLYDVSVEDDASGEQVVNSNQTNFLMASNGALRVGQINKRRTTIATATVELKRVATKITIAVRVEPQVILTNRTTVGEVTINRDEIWEPRMSETNIYLVNGAKNGRVSGVPLTDSTDPTLELFEHIPIYFDYSNGETHSYSSYKLRTNDNGDPIDENGNVIDENNDVDKIYDEVIKNGTFYPTKTPFYSNPVKWFYGSPEEPYLKLVIPWDRVEYNGDVRTVKQSKQYYYRVYCPGSAGDGTNYDAEFLRNHWYKVILNVGILGSETDGGEIIINGTYYVADWQEKDTGSQSGGGESSGVNDSDKETEIKGARYLFVNKDVYDLYNVNTLQIPYITSDPCEIVNFSATRWVFSGSTKSQQTITNMADWGISLQLSGEGGAHISFSHTLDNNLNGTTYDVSEYDVSFRIQQVGNTDYYKDIIIRQSPAIKIDLEKNDVTTSPYSAYVNNGTVTGSNNPAWNIGSVPGSGSSSNNNYNMVIIKTTVLPADSDFMLGDPRTSYVDNLNFSKSGNTYTDTWPTVTGVNRSDPDTRWSANVVSIQGTTRRLSYYHPANPGPESNDIIAPEFRIASSRGATQPMTYANAFRRCASYQEYGYPAGRWRLPTVAEIQYIAKLNTDGKIERLLGGETITYSSIWGQQERADNWQASKTDSDCYTNYWCNIGYMKVYNGKPSNWVTNNGGAIPAPEIGDAGTSLTDGTTNYVRCVYDDWYWNGTKYNNTDVTNVNKTSFTWGDMQ